MAGELSFNGTGGFSGGGNASLRYVLTTQGVSVRIDTDGFGGTDLQFTVAGVTSLDATDFIL